MPIFLDHDKLGRAIRDRIRDSGQTQVEVAARLHMQQGTVSNFCQGKFKTLNRGVERICNYVKIDPTRYRLAATVQPPPDLGAALRRVCSKGRRFERAARRLLAALEDVA